ncbi:MAG TPA: TonB-dependent receptor, partial [Pirellulaceae bacterium]|nr:TonB-dependent receptor [Pirellulaceae bacterium]
LLGGATGAGGLPKFDPTNPYGNGYEQCQLGGGISSHIGFSQSSGNSHSTGYRAAMTWGELGDRQLTVGSDFTLVMQQYQSWDALIGGLAAGYVVLDPNGPQFGLPTSHNADTGVFADYVVPFEVWTLKSGGRFDWVATGAETVGVGSAAEYTTGSDPTQITQSFLAGSAYLSGERALNDEWKFLMGAGVSRRPPTLSDLYADAPFLSITQLGGIFVQRGNTGLVPETAKQLDTGLAARYDRFRGSTHVYCSWVDDFITFTPAPVDVDPLNPSNGRRVFDTVNRNAFLWGAEGYGEYNLTDSMILVGSVGYMYGQDLVVHQPLWGIYPLNTRLALRFVEPTTDPWWGVEFGTRIVASQTRVADAGSLTVAENATPGFTVTDIRGFYRLSQVWALVSGVENVGNRFYQEHLDSRVDLNYNAAGGVYRPGTNFYLTAEARY